MTEHTVPGAEPSGHGGRPLTDDRQVPWRIFAAIGGFVALMGVIYWAAAYEESGIVMLLVAAVLSLWVGGYLWLHERGSGSAQVEPAAAGGTAVGEAEGAAGAAATVEVEEHYLPHASIWPFAIGLGAAALGVGIAIGLWVLVPGVGIMALGIGGFVRQTRRRD